MLDRGQDGGIDRAFLAVPQGAEYVRGEIGFTT